MPTPRQDHIHDFAVRRVLGGEIVPSPLSQDALVRLLKFAGRCEEQATSSVVQGMTPLERGPHGMPIVQSNVSRIQETLAPKDRSKLERLARNMVREQFAIPDEISITATLDPQIREFKKNISLTPPPRNPETDKRRTINAIIQGGASAFQTLFLMEQESIEAIAPGLSQSSRKLLAVADRAIWQIDESRTTCPNTGRQLDLRNVPVGGVVELRFDNGTLCINARAADFPLLIHELVKGAIEALALHGLPTEAGSRAYVLNAADKANYEAWDLRIGKGLWKLINDQLPPEPLDRSRALRCIFELPAAIFNKAIEELVDGRPEIIQAAVRNSQGPR